MITEKARSPSPQFIRSTQAAISYWHKRTQELDDKAIHQLDADRHNLFQAVQFGLALPQTWHNTAEVVLQLFYLVQRRGYWQEGMVLLEQAVAVCPDEQLSLKFELLSRLGQLQRFSQQLQTAIETHLQAHALAQQIDDREILGISNLNLSEDHLRCRDYAATERYGQTALTALHNLEGADYWEALTLETLGEMARSCGDLATSEAMLSQAVVIKRRQGQPIPLMHVLNKLALTLQTAEKFNEALQCYEEASGLLAATSYELDKIMIQVNLGALYFQLEQWPEAEAALRQVNLTYLVQSNKIYLEAISTQNLGNVLVKQNRLEEAIPYLQRAITLWQTMDDKVEQANSMETLGEALVAQGQVTEAIPLYEEAIALLKRFPDDTRAQKLLVEFELEWQKLISE